MASVKVENLTGMILLVPYYPRHIPGYSSDMLSKYSTEILPGEEKTLKNFDISFLSTDPRWKLMKSRNLVNITVFKDLTEDDSLEFFTIIENNISVSGGGEGIIRISSVSVPGGSVSDQVYQDPPQNTLLQSCTVSSSSIEVTVISSTPIIDVDGDRYTIPLLEEIYRGIVAMTVDQDIITVSTVEPDDTIGTSAQLEITVEAPPVVTSLSFTGTYPGSQTELKAGDTFSITGMTDKDADAIEIYDFGACINETKIVSGTAFTITGTIANRGTTSQSLPARVRARDASSGAWGPTRDTNHDGGTTDGVDVVTLNNLYPTATWGTPTYPATQEALKNSESADVPITLSNLDTVLFTSPNSQLDISGPTTIEATKIVTRVAGDYNVSTNNLQVLATRNANGSTTTTTTIVKIANVAPTIQIIGLPSRLRSGGNDGTAVQDHGVLLRANQQLIETPTLDEDSGGGTFLGSWVGGPVDWTRSLRVHDDDTKGTYNFQNPAAKGLAGLTTNFLTGSSQYVLGGFVQRALTFSPFSQSTTLNVAVIDYSKVQANIFTATNQSAVRHTPQGDQGDAADEFTILSPLGTNPQTLWWNDVTAASANSSGTAQITQVEETV